MSRCFPFPPPGYEKRARIDDTDLLTKEKRKEKKHKKDKKDKEKREGKEKKDKERRDKVGDKKACNEKHKDKDRDRDKEKDGTSDEKRVAGQSECYKGEKLVYNLQDVENKDSKYVQELGRRIEHGERATGSHAVQKISFTGQRSEFPGRVVQSNLAYQAEEKQKTNDAKENGRKVNGQRNHVDTRSLENAIGDNFSVMDHSGVERVAKPMEVDVAKPKDGKEKNKHKGTDTNGDKSRDKDKKKKSKSKDKDKAKEKKKEEKTKEIKEQSKQRPKLQERSKESLDTCNVKQLDLSGMSRNSSFSEGILGKRKELDKNGVSHENGIRPHKLPRPVSSSQLVMENGRKSEACQTANQLPSGRQGAANNFPVDIKEHRINGLVGPQIRNACTTWPSSSLKVYENGEASQKPPLEVPQRPNACSTVSSCPKVNDNGEAFTKPPHPDSKYLSRIFSIPQMEEWSDIDDREWLFSSNCLQSKKPKAGSSQVEGTQHVWAEGLPIESADVYALPYVIPY